MNDTCVLGQANEKWTQCLACTKLKLKKKGYLAIYFNQERRGSIVVTTILMNWLEKKKGPIEESVRNKNQ